MRTIYLLLLVLLIPLSVNSQWFWQNPYPSANYPTSVQYSDANTCFSCGYAGMVMKSTNGGMNWTILPYVTNNTLNSVRTLDGNIIFAVGEVGTIIKSADGGNSWTVLSSGVTTTLRYVYMIDNNNVWVTGESNTVLKTANGGTSWDSKPVTGVSYPWNCCYFYDASTGYVGGGTTTGYIYKTVNGGVTWSAQTLPGDFTYIKDLKFQNQNVGIAIGTNFATNAKIIYTGNGGTTWTAQYTSGTTNSQLYSATLANSTTAWVAGNGNILVRTTTFGAAATWNLVTSPSATNSILNGINFFDANNGIIVGTYSVYPRIYKTINGGGSWTSPYTSFAEKSFASVIFKDANTGYVVGEAGCVLQTINGGTNWITKTSPTANTLTAQSFTDVMNGWVCGESGCIYKTPNGGTSWSANQGPGGASAFWSIQMLNSTTGWACGESGIFYKTSDGSTWTSSPSGTSNILYSLFFVDANTGWIVGANNTIRKTINGGGSFVPQTSPAPAASLIYSVYFVNANTGFISTDNGGILKTTDGGSTWNYKLSASGVILKQVYFLNSSIGWAVGWGGAGSLAREYKTIDGGETWIPQYMNSWSRPWSVYFVDANTGWAVGYFSGILKTSTGGGIFVNNISTEVPDNYNLHQNYPNPFNPTTNIKFDILKNENVTLSVYDMLGREISTLVNEKMQPGTYEVTFDGSNLPSGAYFYRLASGDYVETKKMLMIK
jgi:photosystem II stability/assembly factor-like uncharacterized protein